MARLSHTASTRSMRSRRSQRSSVRRAVQGERAHSHHSHAPRAGCRLYGARRRARDRQAADLCGGAGPGLLNSSAALLTAYGMNAPVLALVGQIPQSAIGRGLGHLHEIRDQAGIISRLVDFSARIRAPNEAAVSGRAKRFAPWQAAGPGLPCWNARWMCGAAARRSCDRVARFPAPHRQSTKTRSPSGAAALRRSTAR